MKFQEVNVATARIKGLEKPPYYFDHHCVIMFGTLCSKTLLLFLLEIFLLLMLETPKRKAKFSAISLKRISKKLIFVMAIKLLLFSEMTVVFWQSAAWEKMRGLIQLTNLLRKLSQNSILLLNL